MKFLSSVVFPFSFFIATAANAEWAVSVSEDVINDGKTAVLAGMIDQNHNFVFDCDNKSLSMSLVEEGKWRDSLAGYKGKLVVKVDSNEKKTFPVGLYGRNDNYIGLHTNDVGQIKDLLRQIRMSKNKVLVGFVVDDTGSKWSGEADVSNSTKSVDEFVTACAIKL